MFRLLRYGVGMRMRDEVVFGNDILDVRTNPAYNTTAALITKSRLHEKQHVARHVGDFAQNRRKG
jgi:hypothetical protein